MLLFENVIGLALIALIVWWFWMYQPASKKLSSDQLIIVKNGVYQPAHIELAEYQETKLRFLREDESPCAATLIFPTLDISEELKLGQSTVITLPALAKGAYPFGCQMQMYRGEVVVKS